MKLFMTGAGRKELRIFTYRTVERCTGRLRSLIHALPKHAAGVYGAGKRNKFLPFWKYKIFAMVPEPSTEEVTSPITGPSCLAPGLLRSFCAGQCRVWLLSAR